MLAMDIERGESVLEKKKTLKKEEIISNSSIKKICKEEQITYLALFGSFARKEETEDSDIDLLVRFSGSKSLFKIIRVETKLSEALGRKVDLLTKPAISPYIIDHIMKDIEVIYDEKTG